jgi:hypothetical protein
MEEFNLSDFTVNGDDDDRMSVRVIKEFIKIEREIDNRFIKCLETRRGLPINNELIEIFKERNIAEKVKLVGDKLK